MLKEKSIRPPFVEIGPKAYLFGEEIVNLAKVIDIEARRYDVRAILTPQYADIYPVAQAVKDVLVFAQHMDSIPIGRGAGSVLAESLKAAGAAGVMLNHTEKKLTVTELRACIARAGEVGLYSMVCADSVDEAVAIANFAPDIIACEPSALVGTGRTSGVAYMQASISAVKAVNPDILVLQGAGVRTGSDVYHIIRAGAEAVGTTSGMMEAADKPAMVKEMLRAARRAWDETNQK